MTIVTALPAVVDLVIERGDDVPLTLTARDKAGAEMNLAGCVVWWTLKTAGDTEADDHDAVAQYVWADGGPSSPNIVVADLTTGLVALNLPKTLTATLKTGVGDRYRHDVQIRDAAGKETTPIQGVLTVARDVTIASAP